MNAPATATRKPRMCPCGHDETWHLANVRNPRVRGQCNYGHGTAHGGCRCAAFHTRRSKARAPTLLTPAPTPTIDPVTVGTLNELLAIAESLAHSVDALRTALAKAIGARTNGAPLIIAKKDGNGITPRATLPLALAQAAFGPLIADVAAGVDDADYEDDDDDTTITPKRARAILTAIDVAENTGVKLGVGEKKILEALAMHPDGCDKRRLGILTSYKTRGGRFGNIIGACRSNGWLYEPHRGIYVITPAGRAMVPNAKPLPVGDDLYDHYFSHHKKIGVGERKVMTALRNAFPHPMTTTALAEACDYDPRGGRFGNIVGRLRGLQIIEGKRSPVRLAKELVS